MGCKESKSIGLYGYDYGYDENNRNNRNNTTPEVVGNVDAFVDVTRTPNTTRRSAAEAQQIHVRMATHPLQVPASPTTTCTTHQPKTTLHTHRQRTHRRRHPRRSAGFSILYPNRTSHTTRNYDEKEDDTTRTMILRTVEAGDSFYYCPYSSRSLS